jgi:hypothetical protein
MNVTMSTRLHRAPEIAATHASIEESSPPAEPPLADETAQRLLAELNRDLHQQIEWQIQQQLAVRRGPALGEAILAVGSMAAGSVVTAILVANSTTLVQGLWGTQTASHLNILPYVLVVWAAVIAINLVWARRR